MNLGKARGYAQVGLALLLLFAAACSRSPEARAAKHLQAAKVLIQKHDYSRAQLEARNAIQANPKSVEAYYDLGLTFEGSMDLAKAVSAYRKVLQLDPHHRDAQFHLAQLMAAYGDRTTVQEAESRLKALLGGSEDVPDTLKALAFTELRLGQPEEAMQYLNEAVARYPKDLAPSLLLAQVKLTEGDVKGAEETLKQLTATMPQSIEAKALLGAFYQSRQRWDEAEQALRQALALNNSSGLVLVQLASLDQAIGKNAEAEQIYKRLSVYSEKEYQPLYALYLFQTGRQPQAIQEFERLYKKDPEDRQARTRLIAAYNGANRRADAQKLLANVLKKNPKDLDALLQRGELLLADKQYARAEADFSQVQHLLPSSPEIHYLQAKLNQARGNVLLYRQELGDALRLNPALMSVRLELVQSFLQANDGKTALDLLNEAPEAQKQLPPFIEARNWAFWALGNLPAMRAGIDHGLGLQRTTQLLIQDGLYKLRTGDAAGARKVLEEALQIDPSDLLALRALNQSYRILKENPLAVTKVKEYAARAPKSADVQEFLGELLSSSGDAAGARAAFMAAKADSPEFIPADLALVRLDIVQGKWEDAQKRLEASATITSGTLPRVWLGILEEIRGQNGKAKQDFQKAVDADPNQAQALNNLAYLLAEQDHSLDEALKYAQRAVEVDPAKPNYADTLGWILYQKGLYSSAIPYLEKADTAPRGALPASSSAVWKYHLAMAYAKTGDQQRSRTTLEAALKINPRLPEAKTARDLIEASH